MLLTLWIIFLVLSLVLIVIGLWRTEHTELTLIGFFFMFLLSLVLVQGSIEYKVGENYTYSCLCCESARVGNDTQVCLNETSLYITSTTDKYEVFDSGGTLSHLVGYWLLLCSAFGFGITLFSLKKTRYGEEE